MDSRSEMPPELRAMLNQALSGEDAPRQAKPVPDDEGYTYPDDEPNLADPPFATNTLGELESVVTDLSALIVSLMDVRYTIAHPRQKAPLASERRLGTLREVVQVEGILGGALELLSKVSTRERAHYGVRMSQMVRESGTRQIANVEREVSEEEADERSID